MVILSEAEDSVADTGSDGLFDMDGMANELGDGLKINDPDSTAIDVALAAVAYVFRPEEGAVVKLVELVFGRVTGGRVTGADEGRLEIVEFWVEGPGEVDSSVASKVEVEYAAKDTVVFTVELEEVKLTDGLGPEVTGISSSNPYE